MKTQHTPGPWKVAPNGSIVTSDMTQTVAPCIDNEANSRLISATPELLVALESALNASGGDHPMERFFGMAETSPFRHRKSTGGMMPYITVKWDEFGEPLMREWREFTYLELLEKLGKAPW